MKDHRPNKLSDRAVTKIKQDWLTGISLMDLAAEHDVSPKAIWYHVKSIPRDNAPTRGPQRSFDYGKVLELHNQGLSTAVLAERFGVSRFHIHRAIREARMEWKTAA
jgi:biotin operon repressor